MRNFQKHPDVSQASRIGEPTLVDPQVVSATSVLQDATKAMMGNGADKNPVSVEAGEKGALAPDQPAPRSDQPSGAGPAGSAAAGVEIIGTNPGATAPGADATGLGAAGLGATGLGAAPPPPAEDPNELKPNVAADPNELKPNVDAAQTAPANPVAVEPERTVRQPPRS